MITESDVYWITRLDHFRHELHVIGSVLIVGGWMPFFGMLVAADIGKRQFSRLAWLASTIPLMLLLVVTCGRPFIPTTREMCAIKVIPVVANNEDLRGLGTDIVGLAREWVNELRGTEAKYAVKQELEK